MAKHQSAPATTSRSPNKSFWLTALQELKREFLASRNDVAALLLRSRRMLHLPAAPPSSWPWTYATEPELADHEAYTHRLAAQVCQDIGDRDGHRPTHAIGLALAGVGIAYTGEPRG